MKEIVDHYIQKLITSDLYYSEKPCKDSNLLVTFFREKVASAITNYQLKFPGIEVVYVETYRSNALQLKHFNNRASKIKKDGMHHYGIAADFMFKIDGHATYQGDFKSLRQCFLDEGLFLLGEWDAGHVQGIAVEDQSLLRTSVTQGIKNFQQENGLTADGIVGPNTINKAKELFLS